MATCLLAGLQAFVADIGLRPVPSLAEADILNSPIDIYHSYLAERLLALVECDPLLVYNSIQPSKTIDDGDLDIVLPKLKLDGVKPKELAGELLNKVSKFISSIHVVQVLASIRRWVKVIFNVQARQIQTDSLFTAPFKDGIHIRFYLSTKTLYKLLLPYISDRKLTYGNFSPIGSPRQPESTPQKIIVEFSSPNIAREFTVAHLRSTIIGAFVANLFEAAGCSVHRVNYLGDWGKNLGLLAVGWRKYGLDTAFNEQPENTFKNMHELYMKMERELQPEQEARKRARADGQDTSLLENQGLFAERDANFKRMEDCEVEEIAFWHNLRDISIAVYTETYARLNIKFDEYSGESQVVLNSGAVTDVESVLKEQDIWEEQNGAWVIDFDKHGAKLGTATIRDRNGSTSYLLRDIATVFDRFKTHEFDKMVYVVCEQDLHFRQVFKAVELMGRLDVANKLHHVTFSKPSSTSPTVSRLQLLGDIISQAETQMLEAIVTDRGAVPVEGTEGAVRMMGINSMIIQELSSRKGQWNGLMGASNLFDLSSNETGTTLQLCYTRLCTAIAKSGASDSFGSDTIAEVEQSAVLEPPWSDLLRLISRYPNVNQAAFEKLEPSTILSYLFRVVEELSLCLDAADEADEAEDGSAPPSKHAFQTAVYQGVRQVLENGMRLLGAAPVTHQNLGSAPL